MKAGIASVTIEDFIDLLVAFGTKTDFTIGLK
jgi:hypothetical protein